MCGHLLSSGLELADLKPHQQVVLADAMAQVGLGDGVQLGGWNWHTKHPWARHDKLGVALISEGMEENNMADVWREHTADPEVYIIYYIRL